MTPDLPSATDTSDLLPVDGESHSSWRRRMADRLAAALDPARFGVAALYLLGSTRNANAGPGSDIDIMIHFTGTRRQQDDLIRWLDHWSRLLAEINCRRTGCKTDGLLDVHIVTDEDIRRRTSYTVKIGALSDSAVLLPLGTRITCRG